MNTITSLRSSIGLLAIIGCIIAGYYVTRPIGADALVNQALIESVWVPTLIIACISGAALATAGFLTQNSLDNGFASPSTLGVSSGALLGATLVRILLPESSLYVVWAGSLIGGILLASIVIFSSKRLAGGKLAIILIGMALGLSAGAVASALILFFEHETDGMFIWGSGQILQSNFDGVVSAGPLLAILIVLSYFTLPQLRVMALGDSHAQNLGVNVSRWRILTLFLAILIESLVIAVVGMIGFVGLVAPHIARALIHKQSSHKHAMHWLLSMGAGIIMVLIAEWASRSLLFIGYRLPTGAMCALVGAPFIFMLLLFNKQQLLAAMEQRTMRLRPLFSPAPIVLLSIVIIFTAASIAFWLRFDASAPWVNTRVVVSALAGFSLGLTGALLQTIFRNPMASPDTLGVSNFGILAIALLLVAFPGAGSLMLSIACLLGASLLMLLLTWVIKHNYSIAHIALMGLALSAFASTVVQILLTFGISTASALLLWMSGTSYNASMGDVQYLICVIVLSTVILLPRVAALDILQLGKNSPQH